MNTVFRFFKFLVKKRRVYIAISILISLGMVYSLRRNVPIKANEYTCSVALTSNNNNSNLQYINNDTKTYERYVPYWQIENPFSFSDLYNNFQSTSFLDEAGENVNYRMRYTHKGLDIYDKRPFDLYVDYGDVCNYDNSFEAQVVNKNNGVSLKNVKGFINGNAVNVSDEIFLTYYTPKDTPIGKLIVYKTNENNNWDTNYSIKVNYYNKDYVHLIFDKNMDRKVQGDIIICQLKTDYTFGFVEKLFNSMLSTYEQHVREKYSENYNAYISKIDSAMSKLDKKDPMYSRFEELKRLASYDYQAIDNKKIVCYIDKLYVSERDLVGVVGSFRYVIVVLAFIIIPILLLLLELFIRPININVEDLPENIQKNIIYHVDSAMMSDLDKSSISLLLKKRNYENIFVASASYRCFSSDKFVNDINDEQIKFSSCKSLDEGCNAIEKTIEKNGTLIVLLNLGVMSLYRLKKLNEVLLKSNVDFAIILFE